MVVSGPLALKFDPSRSMLAIIPIWEVLSGLAEDLSKEIGMFVFDFGV